MKIKLKNGETIIDEQDLSLIKQHNWVIDSRGYLVWKTMDKYRKNITKIFHRIVMDTPKGMDTDHINGNKLDNRRSNLRICTHKENCQNVNKRLNTHSVYKGVTKDIKAKTNQWVAYVGGMRIGQFSTELSAAMAYDIWAKDHYGEFAKLNFTPAI